MDASLILFTMKSCPYCTMIKDLLSENNITYHDRDIDIHQDEFELFVEAVGGHDYVPSFMIIYKSGDGLMDSELFVPGRDYEDINEGVDLIKKKLMLD